MMIHDGRVGGGDRRFRPTPPPPPPPPPPPRSLAHLAPRPPLDGHDHGDAGPAATTPSFFFALFSIDAASDRVASTAPAPAPRSSYDGSRHPRVHASLRAATTIATGANSRNAVGSVSGEGKTHDSAT